MNRAMSVYLDLVRFLAALVVFIIHANYERFTGGIPILWRFSRLGNDAVMVFFVLSGFVIAYVVDTKERSIKEFFVSRFARLYSVVLPALVFTVFLDGIGSQFEYHDLYKLWGYAADQPVLRVVSNIFFVNQIWFFDIRPFSNVPFWSIGYEFWYYVIFSICVYLKGKKKYVYLIFVLMFVGPKILILMPIWLMGVLAYKISLTNKIPENIGWIAFVGTFVLYLTYRTFGGYDLLFNYTKNLLGEDLFNRLAWSKEFVTSYVVGIMIMVNFIGFSSISKRLSGICNFVGPAITRLASYTFALYLLHYPLLQFYAAISYNAVTKTTSGILVAIAALFSVWLLGAVTEKQKQRYKKLFARLLRC